MSLGQGGHRWQADRLGSLVRAGLASVRRAEPSDSVWPAIEASLEPGEPKNGATGLLVRLLLHGRSTHAGGLPPLVVLPGAAVLGVIIMFAVALDSVEGPLWREAPSAATSTDRTTFGLSEPEFALQPELDRRLVGVALPPGPIARQAPPTPPQRSVENRPAVRVAADSQALALTSQ